MSYTKIVKSGKTWTPHMGNGSSMVSDIYTKYRDAITVAYKGPTDRIKRYGIYESMEQDPIIHRCLNVIADFISQNKDDNDNNIEIVYTGEKLDSATVTVLETELKNWCELNELEQRSFYMTRDTIKYGDNIFVRDPETYKLYKVNPSDVVGINIDPADGKTPSSYIIKNLNLIMPLGTCAGLDMQNSNTFLQTALSNAPVSNSVNLENIAQSNSMSGSTSDNNNTVVVDAENIVHFSLNIDNTITYPFGISALENIYKTYIQKMMIQDSLLLRRTKSCTDRLIFKIPTGSSNPIKQRAILEKTKNEYSQTRIPSAEAGTAFTTVDVAYSPIAPEENYFLPIDANNRGPSIEKLAAECDLGKIDDLVLFNNEEIRGLGVPASWIDYSPTDNSNQGYNEKPQAVMIRDITFMKMINRYAAIFNNKLDAEFKAYLAHKGNKVPENSYKISFVKSSNFSEYVLIEIDKDRINNFNAVSGTDFISKRFAMKKYLGWGDDEILENEQLLQEEKALALKNKDALIPTENSKAVPGLRKLGFDEVSDDEISALKQNYTAQASGKSGPSELGGGFGGDIGDMGGEDITMNDVGMSEPETGL